MSALRIGAAVVCLGMVGSGCATVPLAKKPATPTASVSDLPLVVSDDLMRSLSLNNMGAVRNTFTAHLREALGEERLLRVWGGIIEKHGRLLSWHLDQRRVLAQSTTFVFKLDFERGAMTGIVSVTLGSGEVGGLFFGEQPFGETSPGEQGEGRPAAGGISNRELSFGEDPFALTGTVTAPDGKINTKAPAVLFVSGSGPQDRDETTGPLKPLRDIAEGLARRGIMSFRYDKRASAHPFLFDACRSTVDEEVIDDAVRALQALRQLPEVDQERIFLVGHSLGALLLPEIAMRGKKVAGLVMLAPPGRRLTDIVLAQLRNKHYPDADALEHRRRQFSELSPQTWWFGAPISYWQNLEARDELGIAHRLDLRTLLVRGDRDENVSSDDLDRWVTTLSPAKTCVLRIPGVNHFLVNIGRDDKPTTTIVDSTIIDNIADFIVPRPNVKASCLH